MRSQRVRHDWKTELNWINLDQVRGLGICFYFQFLMFASNPGAGLEMKCDLRIVFPSNDSGSVVVETWRHPQGASGMLRCFLLALDWFPLPYSSWQLSSLLPGFPLGLYYYNGPASVLSPMPPLSPWSQLGPLSGTAWLPSENSMTCIVSVLCGCFLLGFWKNRGLFLSIRSTARRLWMLAKEVGWPLLVADPFKSAPTSVIVGPQVSLLPVSWEPIEQDQVWFGSKGKLYPLIKERGVVLFLLCSKVTQLHTCAFRFTFFSITVCHWIGECVQKSFSTRGQTDWKPPSQKTNQSDHVDHSFI